MSRQCNSSNNIITPKSSIIPTDYSLYNKYACVTISWYISTSDSDVVGGSGAAATV